VGDTPGVEKADQHGFDFGHSWLLWPGDLPDNIPDVSLGDLCYLTQMSHSLTVPSYALFPWTELMTE
jgi:hypothetical protein